MRYLTIQKTITNKYLLTETNLKFKSKVKLSRYEWRQYDYKLDNSISRAKNNILRICSFNKFYYFFTQTVSPIYDRTDLKSVIDKLSEYTRYLRKKHKFLDFYYLVIPEYHSDKQNWHLHGFLSKGYEIDCYTNENGFLSLKTFNKIGFNSISKIKNYEACIKYATKYIQKSILDIGKGSRLFYCSHNLIRNNFIHKLVLTQIAPLHYEFKSEFCFKTLIDKNKYYNLITKLDSLQRYNIL